MPPAPAGGRARAFRGLFLVFVLSFLGLVGVLLTVTALGGLGDWSRMQFIGLFGIIEVATGLANVILPNIWRLPVAEVQTKRTTAVRLAPSVLLIPHWGALARVAAGGILIIAAAWTEGVAPATAGMLVFIALFAVALTAASVIVAKFGVDYPHLDVVQFIIKRPRVTQELPPISIGASVVQFVLGILAIPLVKAIPPSAFFLPEIGASWATLAISAAAAAVLSALAAVAWRGRIDWQAPREQQREAEEYA